MSSWMAYDTFRCPVIAACKIAALCSDWKAFVMHAEVRTAFPVSPQICMQFQKMGVAHAFVTKGLAMAAAAGDDDFYTSQLKPQQVCCVLLGGKGETFNAAEVEALLHQGQAAQVGGWNGESAAAWYVVCS